MKEIKDLCAEIKPLNAALMDQAQARLDRLTKPVGSLGRLEELARQVVGVTGRIDPRIRPQLIATFAADHGVVAEGVSAYPQEVTSQMVLNILAGGAAISVLARHIKAEVWVVDVGVAHDFGQVPGLIDRKIAPGTANLAQGPAMERSQAVEAIRVGYDLAISAARKGFKALATGEMGIGNTTPASALAAVYTSRPVAEVTGRGTGVDEKGFERKVAVIERALALNQPDPADTLDVLAKVGGLEIGAICGFCLGAATARTPVVIDGLISTAGALLAAKLCPTAAGYMIAAHKSVEIGHAAMLEEMGLVPLVDLDLRLGEGTGAALGLGLLEAAVKILNEMATFDSAGISPKRD